MCRDFKHWHMRFESVWDEKEKKVVAGRVAQPLTAVGNTRARGSKVRFLPDDRVFETVRFNAETVSRRLRELAYLNRGLTITFLDDRAPEAGEAEEDAEIAGPQEYRYEGGISDYVRYLNADKTPLNDEPIYLEGQREDVIFRAAVQFTDSYTENVFSYVNNIPTAEGGTHETGFKAAWTKVMNDFARRLGALKDRDANQGDDLREGMTASGGDGQKTRSLRVRPRESWATRRCNAGGGDSQPAAHGLFRGPEASGSGPAAHRKGGAGGEGARGRAQGPRRGAHQERAGGGAAGGKAVQLHGRSVEQKRIVHRGGRQRGRQRQAGATGGPV